jgi:bacillopeptidase F (M6 metalloprotease family)
MKHFFSVVESNMFSTFFLFAILLFVSKPASSQTLFSEDWESGIGTWYADNGLWEVGVPTVGPSNTHSGQNCVGTVLNGNYPYSANTRLISPSIVLPSIFNDESIQLKFWQWLSTENENDQGVLQISVNSGAWKTISKPDFDGEDTTWTQYIADLTLYAGSTIRLGYYFTSNVLYNYPGWYIDDISIEIGTVNFSNPEDFESGIGNWYTDNGLWEVGVPTVGPGSAHSGTNCAGTALNGNYPYSANTRLISPKVTLTSIMGQTPMLFFYQWFNTEDNNDRGLIQISVNDGEWKTISNPITGSGETWTQFGLDLSNYIDSTVRIAFYFTSNILYNHSGWYIDDIRIEGIENPTGVEENNNNVVTNYMLSQNYPNPFNPTTKINYQFPKASFVTLKIYNVLGKEITTLVNEEKPAGIYEVDFNGSGIPSGVYFYKVQIGNSFTQVKKMMLLK